MLASGRRVPLHCVVVSVTSHWRRETIQSPLTPHILTDPSHADKFRDRYVGALDRDTSRALCVFSFNNASAISPILLDRLQIVETDSFDHRQQAQIAAQHLIPQILQERGMNERKVTFSEGALEELVRAAESGGVRAIRSALEQCISKVALWIDPNGADCLVSLREHGLTMTASGALVRGALTRLLTTGPGGSRPPPGMYT